MLVCSACLAGMACKYNGNNNTDLRVVQLVENGQAVPVCPEMLGGLSIPRIPCEKKGNRVFNQLGEDKTDAFEDGAKKALAITLAIGADAAILMSRSPSCGYRKIYDGTFSKHLIDGHGVFAQMLLEKNISIYECDEYFMERTKDDE